MSAHLPPGTYPPPQSPPGHWLPPDTFAPPSPRAAPTAPPEEPQPPEGAKAQGWLRSDRWLLALATVATCLALIVFSGGFQYARATPRYEQAPPGMAYAADGLSVRVLSIVAAPAVRTASGKDESAPSGTVFVVARIEVAGKSDRYLCTGRLVFGDGRAFDETMLSKPDVGVCSKLGQQRSIQLSLYYLVPEASVGQIVGIAVENNLGLARTTVLRPA